MNIDDLESSAWFATLECLFTMVCALHLAACIAPPGSCSQTSVVGGRLKPEAIQSIVRLSYNQFRACYEEGLSRTPTLQGRVSTRFVIERDGRVGAVSDGGSDMPDPKVIDCIVSAFRRLKFPTPECGIVTVVYPIMFSPGD